MTDFNLTKEMKRYTILRIGAVNPSHFEIDSFIKVARSFMIKIMS